MGDVVRSSGLLMTKQVLTAAAGLVRVKVAAVVLGAANMGVLGQAGQLRVFLEQLVNLGIGAGASRYAAQYHSEERYDALERLLGTLTGLMLITGLVVALISSIFSPTLSGLIFKTPDRWVYVILVAIALPLAAQASVVSFVLQGTLRFRAMLVSGVLSAGAGLVITVPMILLAGLDGAIWSIMLSAGAAMIIHQVVLTRVVLRPLGMKRGLQTPAKEILKRLLPFGVVSLVSQASTSLGDLVILSSVINTLGEEARGLYQVPWNVSMQYFAMLVGALFAYALPKFSAALRDPETTRRLYNDVLRVYFIASMPLAVLAIVLAKVWIPILYSGEFLAASVLMPWQMAAQVALGFRVLTNAGLLAHERFRAVLILSVSQTLIQLGAYFLLVPRYGLLSVPIALFASHLVLMVPNHLALSAGRGFEIKPKIRRLIAFSLLVAAGWLLAYSLAGWVTASIIALGLLVPWGVANVHRTDLADLEKVLIDRPEGS